MNGCYLNPLAPLHRKINTTKEQYAKYHLLFIENGKRLEEVTEMSPTENLTKEDLLKMENDLIDELTGLRMELGGLRATLRELNRQLKDSPYFSKYG
jgi:hypothetical protein